MNKTYITSVNLLLKSNLSLQHLTDKNKTKCGRNIGTAMTVTRPITVLPVNAPWPPDHYRHIWLLMLRTLLHSSDKALVISNHTMAITSL